MSDRITEAQEMQPPGELTNGALWRWRVERTPDRRWLWFEGRAWTYREFDEGVRRLAGGLRELGVRVGTRVLVGMGTSPEAIQAHLALGQLGAVCVPLVPGMPWGELVYPMTHSEASIVVADDPIASLVLEHREECPALEQLVLRGEIGEAGGPAVSRFEDLSAANPMPEAPPEGVGPQDLAHIVYTSGSTGRPKGVMLKAGSYYHCGLGYADIYGFRSDDVYFLALTLGHSLGSIAATGIPMVTAGSIALFERFRPSLFWQQAADSGATISVLFPAHLNLLVETAENAPPAGTSTMRLIVTHTDIPAFRERFGVELATVWGMSETLVCVGSDPGYAGELGPGYVGRPFAGGEVGIFDESFQRVGPYEYGELCLRHPQVMIGYLKDPEATAATLVDGWVRSGDRGFMDHSGRAYFAGRFKAMIKRSGENVSSEEVEAALLRHRDVAECAVVAVPDRIRTEEVGAVVVRRSGSSADPGELREAAGESLVRWKLPRFILVVDEPLPRLGNGKIDRVRTTAMINPGSTWDAEKAATAPA